MLVALLVALAQGAPATESAARARWEIAAPSVEVGEPFEATLVVEHPAGAAVEIDLSGVEADLSWLVAGAPRPEAAAGAASAAERVTTRWTCSFASLEAGARALPAPSIAVVLGDGRRATAEVAPAEVQLTGVLGASEDAPREPKDFRPAEPERAGLDPLWIAGLACAALLVLVALALWVRKRRRPSVAREPGALERLDAIAARDLDDPEAVRELHYELTRLVRGHFDALDGIQRIALTDEEWVAAVSVPRGAQAEDLRELMRAADEVKYGDRRPTRWAVDEQIERAKRLVRSAAAPAKVAA